MRASRAGVARRMMSAESHEAAVNQWRNMSAGAGVVSAVAIAYAVFFAEHPHKHEDPGFPYLKIRAKAFPWPAQDCDMLDMECKQAWREAQRGE